MDKNALVGFRKTLLVKKNIIDLSSPIVMGILNVTPDSFFDGNKYKTEEEVLLRVQNMIHQGAAIIDIGGYSTRPNSVAISVQEEVDRVMPHIVNIAAKFPNVPISIDTFRPEVAQLAIEAGAGMVNDVLAGLEDTFMPEVVAKNKVPYIITHNFGDNTQMHKLVEVDSIVQHLLSYYEKKIFQLIKLGISDIVLDPGFGFSKTLSQNYEILKKLSYITHLNLPILVGLSRKSMIYKVIDSVPEKALNGTTALHMVALMNGASILRVHDVQQAKECIQLFNKLHNLEN